jgi:hydroxymethylpyrimidine pyrophosphatase-like HAD family hydrolase
MAMPQGVSKATGLLTMLNSLRLSARNTVATGDAEQGSDGSAAGCASSG